jgi:hypothetical protein
VITVAMDRGREAHHGHAHATGGHRGHPTWPPHCAGFLGLQRHLDALRRQRR